MEKQRDTEIAKKIKDLKIVENILIVATVLVGVVTVVDYLMLDPIFVIDEAGLTSVTGLLLTALAFVKKKRRELINVGETEIDLEEIIELTDSMVDVTKKASTAIKNKTL